MSKSTSDIIILLDDSEEEIHTIEKVSKTSITVDGVDGIETKTENHQKQIAKLVCNLFMCVFFFLFGGISM